MNRKHFKLLEIAGAGLFVLLFCLAGCKSKIENPTDTFTSGTIHISVDESFRPVIEEEIEVYEKSFPGSKIIAEYKTEANCFKDLISDTSNRMIIVTRGLTREEDQYFKDSLNYSPRWEEVASDAITVIVNSASDDTLFTIDRLKKQLTGLSNRNQVNMLRKVKIAYVGCDACDDSPYVKPMQVSILSKRYPLVRGLYYILKENYDGLGMGFTSFMKYERGQLIFKRAYLGTRMGFEVRNVKINEKL
jgi:ABC-type phosphate transport system substrate-binding protein